MKKYNYVVIAVTFIALSQMAWGQSKIKDGSVAATSSLPEANAILELESSDKGLLLPRVTLTSTTSAAPLTGHVQGMTVYNTATTGDVTPGYYYSDGTQWIKMMQAGNEPWKTSDTTNPANGNLQAIYHMGSVGIGHSDPPTAKLDIGGRLRVRNIPVADSPSDIALVADADGNIKKRYNETAGFIRGYLDSNFVSGTTSTTIYKVTKIKELTDPGDNFTPSTSLFTAPSTALYRINITVTITAVDPSYTLNNYVVAFVRESTGTWVSRFSIDNQSVEAGSSAGVAFTFVGVVPLTAGENYYFGSSGNLKILSNPSGTTGTGIGTLFEVEKL